MAEDIPGEDAVEMEEAGRVGAGARLGELGNEGAIGAEGLEAIGAEKGPDRKSVV